MSEQTPHAHDVGSLGEEAAKLLGAAGEWWQESFGRTARAAGAAATPYSGPECLVCPVCQLLAVLRNARPEVFEHLVAASHSLLLAIRAAVDAQEQEWARRRTSAMEHIDIT